MFAADEWYRRNFRLDSNPMLGSDRCLRRVRVRGTPMLRDLADDALEAVRRAVLGRAWK